MVYIGTCDSKGHGFLAVFVINRVSIMIGAILVSNRVWFLQSSLEMGMFLFGRNYLTCLIQAYKHCLTLVRN